MIDLSKGEERVCWGDPRWLLEPELTRLVTPTFSVRSRVRAIGVHPEGDLALLTTKGYIVRLTEGQRGWCWKTPPTEQYYHVRHRRNWR